MEDGWLDGLYIQYNNLVANDMYIILTILLFVRVKHQFSENITVWIFGHFSVPDFHWI